MKNTSAMDYWDNIMGDCAGMAIFKLTEEEILSDADRIDEEGERITDDYEPIDRAELLDGWRDYCEAERKEQEVK